MRFAAALLAVGAVAIVTPAAAVEQVDIPNGDAALRGFLYRPIGAGPFPAVVALHGCGGLTNRAGKLDPRFVDWGERLSGAGLAVLLPDSFGSRGLGSQCRVRERKVRASRERVADAHAARGWLQSQSWVIKERVALLGWSNGGTTSLWAVRPRAAVGDGLPDFHSAVAFYPGCRQLGKAAWGARIPVLILVGKADDWTPAAACERMVADARGRSAQVTLISYPGAYHGFDRPNAPVRQVAGLAFSADGSGRAHTGTNPAARADALKRVPEWLKR